MDAGDDGAVFAVLAGGGDEAVEHRAAEQGVEAGADMHGGMGFVAAGDADGVFSAGGDGFADIGEEDDFLAGAGVDDFHVHGEKGAILDLDSHFLDWIDEKIRIPFPLEDRGEEIDHGLAADRPAFMVPNAVPGDAQVDVAAKRRIPKMHWRRAAVVAEAAHHLEGPGFDGAGRFPSMTEPFPGLRRAPFSHRRAPSVPNSPYIVPPLELGPVAFRRQSQNLLRIWLRPVDDWHSARSLRFASRPTYYVLLHCCGLCFPPHYASRFD